MDSIDLRVTRFIVGYPFSEPFGVVGDPMAESYARPTLSIWESGLEKTSATV